MPIPEMISSQIVNSTSTIVRVRSDCTSLLSISLPLLHVQERNSRIATAHTALPLWRKKTGYSAGKCRVSLSSLPSLLVARFLVARLPVARLLEQDLYEVWFQDEVMHGLYPADGEEDLVRGNRKVMLIDHLLIWEFARHF